MLQMIPKREDGRPLWQVIYDGIKAMMNAEKVKVGDIIPHRQLKDLVLSSELKSFGGALQRAIRELNREDKRSLLSIRGTGYKLIAGNEQVTQGGVYKKRGLRRIKRAGALVKYADRSLMSGDERNWADRVQGNLVTLAMIARMHEERLAQHQEELRALAGAQVRSETKIERSAEEIEAMRRRLEKVEREMKRK